MRIALSLLACLALLSVGLTEGHKTPHGKHGAGHQPQQETGDSQQTGKGVPHQHGTGNSQQGEGDSQQQKTENPPQQGTSDQQGSQKAPKEGSQNTPQEGSQNPQNGEASALAMDERGLDDLINQVKGRLEELSGSAGDKIKDALSGFPKSSGDMADKLRERLDSLAQKLKDRKKAKEEKEKDEEKNGKDGEEDVDLGSGDMDDIFDIPRNKSVVTTDEVKRLLGDIAALAEKIDVPLEAIKSDLVDKTSHIKDAQDLALFLRNEGSQFQLPIRDFRRMIKHAQRMMARLFQGYETDSNCDNFRRDLRRQISKSDELPPSFHAEFLQKYLMSVSCMATDNALFKTDLAMLQELDEGSSRDEVLAAITKALVGSIRLTRKMVDQTVALKYIMAKLPEPGVPDDAIVYKRLI